MLEIILGALALLSFGLFCWQWLLGIRFPLHQRLPPPSNPMSVTILKPLKGCDGQTEACLRSWLTQEYPAPVQVLFGVQSPDDPVCKVVRGLIAKHPQGELVMCPKLLGSNAKVSTLMQLETHIKHELVIISDADVFAPPDLLTQLQPTDGLACCFYQISGCPNLAGRLEAFATNSDFWSQVLQATVLKPMDFALGAVMAFRRETLVKIRGFGALLDYLADDYQLGKRVGKVGLCRTVVECRSSEASSRAVWSHQVRWARTIWFCQPTAFFFSILSIPTIWLLLWLFVSPSLLATLAVVTSLELRSIGGALLERKLTGRFQAGSILIAPLSDLFRAVFWLLAFIGNTVVWRGRTFRVKKGGKLIKLK